jgi:hypothetical protein
VLWSRGTKTLKANGARTDKIFLSLGGNALYLKVADANSRGAIALCLKLMLMLWCKASHARAIAGVRGFAHFCAGYGNI